MVTNLEVQCCNTSEHRVERGGTTQYASGWFGGKKAFRPRVIKGLLSRELCARAADLRESFLQIKIADIKSLFVLISSYKCQLDLWFQVTPQRMFHFELWNHDERKTIWVNHKIPTSLSLSIYDILSSESFEQDIKNESKIEIYSDKRVVKGH